MTSTEGRLARFYRWNLNSPSSVMSDVIRLTLNCYCGSFSQMPIPRRTNPYQSPNCDSAPPRMTTRLRQVWTLAILILIASTRLLSVAFITYAICIEIRHGNLRWLAAGLLFGVLIGVCIATHFIQRNSRFVPWLRFPPYILGVTSTILAYTFGWLPSAI